MYPAVVFQTGKGVPISKGTGLANPNPCKQENSAWNLLEEKSKTVHFFKSLQSQEEAGIIPLSFLVSFELRTRKA